jgi:hypothetical protein
MDSKPPSPSPHSSPSRPGGRELRAAPRVPCDIEVAVTQEDSVVVTRLRDISATGAAVHWARPLELGEVLQLSFELPDEHGTEVACAGLVRSFRPEPSGDGRVVGLEFHKLVGPARKAVAEFVRRALSGEAPAEGRRHWVSGVDIGNAQLVPDEERGRPALRWSTGFASLWAEVASHLGERETIFVPTHDATSLHEGERLYLEVVPPGTHAVFRMLGEVTWVQRAEGAGNTGAAPGVGVRLAGLSPLDRFLVHSVARFFEQEAERYR